MQSEFSVLISICTYKRNELLTALLRSIESADKVPEFKVSVAIIDNDSNMAAEGVVSEFSHLLPINYFVEPERNISKVRNVGINYSIEQDFDYILFLDDDEFISKSYFTHVYNFLKSSRPDVIFGPSITRYRENTPSWVKSSKVFERERKATGTIVLTGSTANAFVSVSSISEMSPFDLEYGKSGGEDSEFFYRCNQNGLNMQWCDEAEAYEYVHWDRCSLGYALTRARRGGQTFSKIRYSKLSPLGKVFKSLNCMIFGVSGLTIGTIIVALSNRQLGVKLLTRSIAKLAQIEGLFGKAIFMYGE